MPKILVPGALLCLLLAGCSDDASSSPPAREEMDAELPAELDASADAAPPVEEDPGCTKASDCEDGIACTLEACEQHKCVYRAVDADRDGAGDGNCLDLRGVRTGDDCDDEDPGRYPGKPEYCTIKEPAHDEDCDDTTIGLLDTDGDGETSALCSNGGSLKGTDCNDKDLAIRSKQVEFCDEKDNDCNGQVDDKPQKVTWYRDKDADLFGGAKVLGVSCEPLEGGSVLATDCDDGQVTLHPAQAEVCDKLDNNCNGIADDGFKCGNVPGVGPAVAAGGEAAPVSAQVVTAKGGVLEHPEQVLVSVPADAVDEPVELSVRKAALEALASIPPGFQVVSSAYSFAPHGIRFAGGVSLVIPYVASGPGEVKALRLNDEADPTWSEAAVELQAGSASVTTDRFSVYVIVQRIVVPDEAADGGVASDAGESWGRACPAIGLRLATQAGSCTVGLEQRASFSYLLVTLDGAELKANDLNGFTLKANRLTLRGTACASFRDNESQGLEAIVTCEALRPNDPSCLPFTCEELGAECGSPADGCGGTANCDQVGNACKAPETCGGAGEAYQCGEPDVPDAGPLPSECPAGFVCSNVLGAGFVMCGVATNAYLLPPSCTTQPECDQALPGSICFEAGSGLGKFCVRPCTP